LTENRLWLQAAFGDLQDRQFILEQRQNLLEQLAGLIKEMPPSAFAKRVGGALDNDGMGFGEQPPVGLARAAQDVQRVDYEASAVETLLLMWRQRAQFMLHLKTTTDSLKLQQRTRHSTCELCGGTQALQVVPIYSQLHLASSYRQQRDMSPLWNMPLWQHFYQTFTPTCTLCNNCANKYHAMNQNIPVDENRFQRLQVQTRTAHDLVREADLPVAPIAAEAVDILKCWLAWTRNLAAGEDPREFLPRYGIDGRTANERRRARLLADRTSEAEAESLPSFSDSEQPEGEPDEDKQRLVAHRPEIDLQEEDEPQSDLALAAPLTWSQRAIMGGWLGRARERMQAPQLSDWSRPDVPMVP